jgi:replication fork clamp-binding protein CrfC
MRDSTKIRQEIARLYDKDPRGWKILVGKDTAGFFDVLISHGTEAWQVKEYQVNPYKFVGLGSRLSNLPTPPFAPNEYPFGLRPLRSEDMAELAKVIDEPGAMSELASKLLSEKPISSREALHSPAVLQGPILHSNRPLEGLSTAQTRLDEKLRKELRRIVHKEFRHTTTPYI